MSEEWKELKEFPSYEVSNHGRFRRWGKVLPLAYHPSGAPIKSVQTKHYQTNVRIVRLVGAAFCADFRPELRPVYQDGNHSNCHYSNLSWVPVKDVTRAPYSKTPRPQRKPISEKNKQPIEEHQK